MSNEKTTYCGFVAIVGRPNVGKSTLLNRLVGEKISITSRKPQTTRHRITGIDTEDAHQVVYVDTPGLHLNEKKALNRYMNKMVDFTMQDVDAIIFVVDVTRWTDEDDLVMSRLEKVEVPVLLVVNKVDCISDKETLLPYLTDMQSKYEFKHIIPMSAAKDGSVSSLKKTIQAMLPESPHFYYPDQVTDRSERFLCAEIIREKLFRFSGNELPYSVAVEIEEFKLKKKCYHISALILVEKDGHKKMFIGKNGDKLKTIGQQARIDLEKMLEQKVFLRLWIKVKRGWSDDERALRSLGYSDD